MMLTMLRVTNDIVKAVLRHNDVRTHQIV